MTRFAIAALLVLSACPAKQASTLPGGPSSGGGGAPISGTLADAPTHALGGTLDVKPACNQDSYLKLDVPAGRAFKVTATVSAGSATVSVLDKNGAQVTSLEATTDKPALVESQGQADATYVSVSETGACTGITVTLAME